MIRSIQWHPMLVYQPSRAGIYFAGASKLTKIGHSNNILARLREIQTHCPEQISLVAFIEVASGLSDRIDVEAWIHQRLWPYRRHGEWFENDGVREWLEAHYWRSISIVPKIRGTMHAPIAVVPMLNEDWPTC